jgi:histidinol-phosphate aminotransferase
VVKAWNASERAWLAGELATRGCRVLPSQTNFVLVDLGRDAAPFEKHLFERGVIVRPMGGYGLGESVRISVGSRAENLRLLDALP